MKRDIKMTIEVPADMEEDFRLFIVLHGGAIISRKKERIPVHTQKCDDKEIEKKLKDYCEKM